MDTTAKCPRCVTSKRTIIYRKSEWDVHELEIWSGEMLCRIVALRMPGSLLVWLGGSGGGGAVLGAVALGVPAARAARGALGAASTALVGGEDAAAEALARRLAAALARPVHVLCAASFDRFTLPLIERALLTHLKSLPAHS